MLTAVGLTVAAAGAPRDTPARCAAGVHRRGDAAASSSGHAAHAAAPPALHALGLDLLPPTPAAPTAPADSAIAGRPRESVGATAAHLAAGAADSAYAS